MLTAVAPPFAKLLADARQISGDAQSPLAAAFLAFAFPRYFDRPRGLDGRPAPLVNEPPTAKLRRRFAGDILSYIGARDCDLGRKRFHALATPDGTDRGLLRAELTAYAEFAETGAFLLFDGLLREDGMRLGFTGPQDCLVAALLPQSRAKAQFAAFAAARLGAAQAAELDRHPGRPCLIRIETASRVASLDRVLDLRRPQARQWCFETFRKGVHGFPGYGEVAPGDGFDLMLPTLLHPARGGALACQVIGADLRRRGCEGLVAPSARADAQVTVEDGRITDWRGWVLVDYRGAPPALSLDQTGIIVMPESALARGAPRSLKPGMTVFFDIGPLWNPPGAPQMRLGSGEGRLTGSLRVEGLEDRLDDAWVDSLRTEPALAVKDET